MNSQRPYDSHSTLPTQELMNILGDTIHSVNAFKKTIIKKFINKILKYKQAHTVFQIDDLMQGVS